MTNVFASSSLRTITVSFLPTLTSIYLAQHYSNTNAVQSSSPSSSPSSPLPTRDIPSLDTSVYTSLATLITTETFQPLPVVGGHDGILTNKEYILKPFKDKRGEAEANFYLQIYHPSRRFLPPAIFTPNFYGIYYHDRSHTKGDTIENSPSNTTVQIEPIDDQPQRHKISTNSVLLSEYITRYIMLEDLTKYYKKPCIMDIKIGIQTWDEDAKPEKIFTEINKYPIQQKIGFRFTGMRVWDNVLQTYREHGREYGYALNDKTMVNAFTEYLYNGKIIRHDIIPLLIKKLQNIEEYFIQQNEYRFYGSSLLFIYEGEIEQSLLKNTNNPTSQSHQTDIRMIDFAHVWPIRDGPHGRDTGYLLGLRNIIHYLESVNYGAGMMTGISTLQKTKDELNIN